MEKLLCWLLNVMLRMFFDGLEIELDGCESFVEN